MDLSNKSLDELNILLDQIQREIQSRKVQQVAKAREQILSIAQSIGLPIEAILKGNGPGPKKAQKADIKYRNPNDLSQGWSGRGRQPLWVKAWLDDGKPIEGLAVAKS